MKKGFIYLIRASDKLLLDRPHLKDSKYIGQTMQSVERRFSQHKRAANNLDISSERKRYTRNAYLHELMAEYRPHNFVVETLHEITEPASELKSKLNKAEQEQVKLHQSLDSLNKVAPPRSEATNIPEGTVADLARQYGVPQTTLWYWLKKDSSQDPETVAKGLASRCQTVFRYGRQNFSSLVELSKSKTHNPNRVNEKTIQRRVRLLHEEGKLVPRYSEDLLVETIELPNDVFRKVRKRDITLLTPAGTKATGSIKGLQNEMLSIYPDLVPEKYGTIQSRILKGWTPEQAFGFDYPPIYQSVKQLLEEGGYKWASGRAPDFRSVEDVKPVVLNQTREIFQSQKAFAREFKLPEDQISELIGKQMSADDILSKYKLAPE